MKKKLILVAAIAILLVSILSGIVYSTKQEPLSKDLSWICGTSRIDNKAILRKYGNVMVNAGNPSAGIVSTETTTVVVSDDYKQIEYPQDFELVMEGDYARIWIGLNGTYGDYSDSEGYHFFYPWTGSGTSWLPPGYHDVISMENLTYILDQFDGVIYPTDIDYFGVPLERAESGGKIDVLIFNIRDELFWSPETAPYYVAGYFSSAASTLNERNIIHIDTYQWTWRLGPDPPYGGPSRRPFMYEGVVTHEFEHLIHFDMDSDEESWVDEGCADYAEFLCGYGHPQDHIANYLVYHPFTSLTVWGGGLENYGASYLFMLYLSEQYGGADLISAIVKKQANGIAGVSNALVDNGVVRSFDEIFDDWTIANYLDNEVIEGGKYGYTALEIPSADTWGWSIQIALSEYWGVPPYNGLPNRGGGSFLPFTAHYYRLDHGSPQFKVIFDGDDESAVIPHTGVWEWWSTMANWAWYRLHHDFSVPAAGATLKFWTYYEIEENWDYGYVEVHDLTTDKWTTLPGIRTTSTLPYKQDNPNTDADFEPMYYEGLGRWNALTGFSNGWYQEQMSLNEFAGHNIELYFTYWTDGAYMDIGWYIDDIEISEIPFIDPVEDVGDWSYNAGWTLTTGIVDNNFNVNFVHVTSIGTQQTYGFTQMTIDHATESGQSEIIMRSKNKLVNLSTIMIVSNHQPGAPLRANYAWKVMPLGWGRVTG